MAFTFSLSKKDPFGMILIMEITESIHMGGPAFGKIIGWGMPSTLICSQTLLGFMQH